MNEDYEVLELEAGASKDKITAAYERLNRVWDPANFGYSPRLQTDAEEQLIKIKQSYERLLKAELDRRSAEMNESRDVENRQTATSESEALSSPLSAALSGLPSHATPLEHLRPTDGAEIARRHKQLFRKRPIPTWEGESFVFMRMRKSLQKFGYQAIFKDSRVGKSVAVKYDTYRGGSLPYEEFTGRVAVVSKLKQGLSAGFWRIELRLEDTGEKLLADADSFSEVIPDIALVADIENARSLYVGTSLWTTHLLHVYDEDTDELDFVLPNHEGVTFEHAAVKVLDVIAGWSTTQPVRFIVETTNGAKGFIDVILSGTNSPEEFRKFHGFDKVFQQIKPSPKLRRY
jgi:hypothetical protein